MPKLLLATLNTGKIREIQSILGDLGVELLTPADLELNIKVVEDGQNYAENAIHKAMTYSQTSGLTALGDDSGLEVDALGGAPGLYSARYAPIPKATDADRRAYLLANLRGKPQPWTARFRATVAIATPEGRVELATGVCPGEIIPEERGMNGFGYDPIFYLPELDHTMAELDMDEKNRLSHRARAIQNARPILAKIFGL